MNMWSTIKEMLKSKKALAMLVSGAVWIAGKEGAHWDNETLLGLVTPVWTYILAQGVADHGKEKAKIEAGKPETPPAS
jgi:hypothetical protein